MLPQTGCEAFGRDFSNIFNIATREVHTSPDLEAMLSELYGAIFNVDMGNYDVDELRAEAALVMRATYQLRMSLRDRLADWETRQIFTGPAEIALRNVFRASRYATDMLGELTIGYDQMDPGEKAYRAFTGPHNNTLIRPEFETEGGGITFQSGDVIVVRGLRHNSAAIARVGDVDSQFSHAALIHIDEKGRHRALEALIEEGATVSNFDYALEHGLGRAILFRHHDPDMAARAADRIYERFRKSRSFTGKHIFYDFSMELGDYTEMFCSKVIREGFDKASGGLVLLPTYPTEFRNAPKDFTDRIGVTAEVSFAPGDMELETQFHAVAEWRDYRKTSRIRLMDMVMVKLFEWMSRGYVFRPGLSIKLIGFFGKLTGYLPNFIKDFLTFVLPKVPSNMQARTIEAIAMLHKTAEPLFQRLHKLELKSIAETGRPLHPRDIYAHLDEWERQARGKIGYLRQK